MLTTLVDDSWVQPIHILKVNELKIIILVLNDLTVFVYTKTIIHLSVGG